MPRSRPRSRSSPATSRSSRPRASAAIGDGGFKIYDISDKARPREIAYQKTYGFGVHRFDVDARYAYISTEMEGYLGNILVVYDIARAGPAGRGGALVDAGPARRRRRDADLAGLSQPPAPRACAAATSCGPRSGTRASACSTSATSRGRAMVGCVRLPPAVSGADAHRHAGRGAARRTALAVAVDEEHDHVHGQPHGFMWVFDVTDLADIRPLVDVPAQRARFALEPRLAALRRASVPGAPGRQPGLPHLVRRRPAHRRHRRPDAAQGGRPLHPRAGERPARAAEQRRRPRRARPDLPDRPRSKASTSWSSGDSESKGAAPADRPFVRGGERTGR